jgi:hypothetical protein
MMAAIFDHWLAGETETELATNAKLNVSQICRILESLQTVKRDTLQISEQPPIYNVWNFASCDPRFGQKHPGQIPGQAILLKSPVSLM